MTFNHFNICKFLSEIETEYPDLSYCTAVQWLGSNEACVNFFSCVGRCVAMLLKWIQAAKAAVWAGQLTIFFFFWLHGLWDLSSPTKLGELP